MVFCIFLYAVEIWPVKQRQVHSLEVFHHRCLRTVLSISKAQQIEQHISYDDVRDRVGMSVPLGDIISSHRLRWLGHLGRLCDNFHPEQMLFGWLSKSYPTYLVKFCWQNQVRKDLKLYYISEWWWMMVPCK